MRQPDPRRTAGGATGTVSVNADRYASLEYQGIYLRNEWGDVLFPDLCPDGAPPSAEAEPLKPDELIGDGRPGRFYQRTAAITATWAARLGILPKPIPQALIYQVTASDVPKPEGYFDVVTCANVLDRVNDPAAFARELTRLPRPGGLLVIASPMHFDEHYTSRDKWIGDVHEVLDPGYWRVDDREVDVRYEFWQGRRRIISYLSQVVGAVRRPESG